MERVSRAPVVFALRMLVVMVTEVVMVAVMLAVEEEVEGRARNKHGSSSVNCLRLSRITIN